MTIFWIFVGLLCLLNAADVITTHLIFRKSLYPIELNPLLAWLVKKGASFAPTLALLKVAAIGIVVGSLWGTLRMSGGETLVPALLGFVDGWYAAIVARNIEEWLRLR